MTVVSGRVLRVVTYQPSTSGEERTIAGWLVRAVLALPASVDVGQAAALLGVSPRQIRAIRECAAQRSRSGASRAAA